MKQVTLGTSGLHTGIIAFGERPTRAAPGTDTLGSDIYAGTPQERADIIRAALDAGITFFHAAHEREAASLGASLRTLGVRDQIIVSTTDGDALDRCPNTEEGAMYAITAAIARKRTLLEIDTLDVFCLYDFRRDVHTAARLAGARQALELAVSAGHVRHIGATCYHDYDALADAVTHRLLPFSLVLSRFNYADQRAAETLVPACRAANVGILAAQPFAWIADIPFTRFPNTWRLRNMTKNFYGFTAGQAHVHWILQSGHVDAVLASMQTTEQVAENAAAAEITKAPTDLPALFASFVEALTTTREGWRGLLTDDHWEYRAAAEAFLSRKPAR
jgi:aryl-alcohol dehydrogenase-like predicted oxidoreductase